MTDTKFTKGPWSVSEPCEIDRSRHVGPAIEGHKTGIHVGDDKCIDNVVADVWLDSEHSEANARLIAAAPELYEAVRKAKQLASIATDWNLDEVEIDGTMVDTYTLHEQFKAALVKAEGEDSHA